jgi:hypothetical protein
MIDHRLTRSALAFITSLLIGHLSTGCMWEYSEDCDECDCNDSYWGDGSGGGWNDDGPGSYWYENECYNIDPDDPCQQAICEAIEAYEEALTECQWSSEDCDCGFIETCMVELIVCIELSCTDAEEHDVGAMVGCTLAFSSCIDPC